MYSELCVTFDQIQFIPASQRIKSSSFSIAVVVVLAMWFGLITIDDPLSHVAQLYFASSALLCENAQYVHILCSFIQLRIYIWSLGYISNKIHKIRKSKE